MKAFNKPVTNVLKDLIRGAGMKRIAAAVLAMVSLGMTGCDPQFEQVVVPETILTVKVWFGESMNNPEGGFIQVELINPRNSWRTLTRLDSDTSMEDFEPEYRFHEFVFTGAIFEAMVENEFYWPKAYGDYIVKVYNHNYDAMEVTVNCSANDRYLYYLSPSELEVHIP
jgi:hypothetical protein